MMHRALPLVAALAIASGAAGQSAVDAGTAAADSAALARVAAHLDAARFDSARTALEGWRTQRAPTARPSDRATADLLGARLETDGIAAQHAWLSLALAHPFGPDAGLALLRVGQAAVLTHDTAAANVYLRRLIDDFPNSGHVAEAHLWLARSRMLANDPAHACESARAGLAAAGSSEVIGLLRAEEQTACAAAARPSLTETQPVTADGPYAVQSGAFRTRTSADALLRRLRQAGFEPRLVRVPANDLMRVRIGGFSDSGRASSLRQRVRDAGFDAVVVDDADRESPVR